MRATNCQCLHSVFRFYDYDCSSFTSILYYSILSLLWKNHESQHNCNHMDLYGLRFSKICSEKKFQFDRVAVQLFMVIHGFLTYANLVQNFPRECHLIANYLKFPKGNVVWLPTLWNSLVAIWRFAAINDVCQSLF